MRIRINEEDRSIIVFEATDIKDGVFTFSDNVDEFDLEGFEFTEEFSKRTSEVRIIDFYNVEDVLCYSIMGGTSMNEFWDVFPNLEEVRAPMLTYIGDGFLKDCKTLKTAYFDSAKEIGCESFSDCIALRRVYCPKVEIIGNEAFYECGSMHSIYLPDTLKEIRTNAFMCSGLYTIDIPKSVKLYDEAFCDCEQLKHIRMHDVRQFNKGEATKAFSACVNLKTLELNVVNKKDRYPSVGRGCIYTVTHKEECKKILCLNEDDAYEYAQIISGISEIDGGALYVLADGGYIININDGEIMTGHLDNINEANEWISANISA